MSKIRELKPAHKSDKLTVSEAARAFKTVQSSSRSHTAEARYVRRDENGRFTSHDVDSSSHRSRKSDR